MHSYYRDLKVILAFVAPAFVIYAVGAMVPVIQTFYFSFFQWSGIYGTPLEYVGFANFVNLFQYGEFWTALSNIARFVALSLIIQIGIGYTQAIVLGTYLKGYRTFKTIFFIPLVITITAVGLIWRFILLPDAGALNTFLTAIGLEEFTRAWLIDQDTALLSLILITGWISAPYYLTIGFAAVSSIPMEIHEAAEMDGARGLRKVVFITIPLVWESLKISIILVITGVLKIFEIVFVMTQGGPNGLTQVPVTLMYYEAFRFNNYGRGSAVAVVVFLLSISLTIISLRVLRRKQLES